MTQNTELQILDEQGELALNLSYQLREAELRIKEMEAFRDQYIEKIRVAMEERGIKKFENEFVSITYIEPTSRVSFDSKALKEADIETYAKYTKESPVKSSVRIRSK